MHSRKQYTYKHGLINHIGTKANCRNLKQFTWKGTLRAGVHLSEAPSFSLTPYPPPPYTLYICMLYTYSHREGGGES